VAFLMFVHAVITIPSLGANGKANWMAAVSGGANSSEVAKCYKVRAVDSLKLALPTSCP
jgi:hypothetical protein